MSLRIVDADAHVIETPKTFSYIDGNHKRYRPVLLQPTDTGDTIQTQGGVDTTKTYWLVDGQVWSGTRNQDYNETTAGQREMTDIEGRLAHMDQMGIDAQVLYPTFFLSIKTESPEWEWALARSYNRWLADVWKQSNNRLRWVAIPPLRSMDKVRDELKFCKDNGACGIFLVGMECDRELDDPYFYPLWEAAQELDLAACIHSGNHSGAFMDLYKNSSTRFMTNRTSASAPSIPSSCATSRRSSRACAGASSSSAPRGCLTPSITPSSATGRTSTGPTGIRPAFSSATTSTCACQVTDDLPYIIDKVGEDNLVIGTDYGHHDQATEIDVMRKIRDEGTLPAQVVDKILDANARRLYGLA